MADELVAKLLGHLALQRLDLLVLELDHLARLDIDQMIVVGIGYLLIARAAVAEVVALEDIGLLEQAHGAIDRGDGDMRIDGDSALVKLLHIRMVLGFREHARDHAALLRHLQTLVLA